MTDVITNTNKRLFLILEISAIVLGFLYTILYIKEVKFCFVFAVLGALAYLYLCIKKKIFAEAFLQFFYIPMAVYGWIHWGEYNENSYEFSTHMYIVLGTLMSMVLLGVYLRNKTQSKSPFLDSFTTIFSLSATWLMVNFIHEMWLYFIAINFVSMFLYYSREMKFSVVLYAFYTYISVAMWFGWELFF